MPTTGPQTPHTPTAESTIYYDPPRGQLYRAPEGVLVTVDGDTYTLTTDEARAAAGALRTVEGPPTVALLLAACHRHLNSEDVLDLADQLVEAAIESENAPEADDVDRTADAFRSQFG